MAEEMFRSVEVLIRTQLIVNGLIIPVPILPVMHAWIMPAQANTLVRKNDKSRVNVVMECLLIYHKNKIKTSSNLNLLKYELRILQTAIATKSQPNFYQWLMLNIEVDNCSASRTALIGDKCYSAFKEKVSWHTAKANCEALGLTLASIDNQAEITCFI